MTTTAVASSRGTKLTSSGRSTIVTLRPAASASGFGSTPISVTIPSAVTTPGMNSAAPTNWATNGVAGR